MRPIRSVSVLMPTWQGIEFLDRVLDSLAAQACALPWDFLAIDSGSTDGTWECLERHAARFPVPLRCVRIHKVEFDHGDTRNVLAALSTGDLLVYLTQDAIPAGPRWLATLVENFQDERVGAAYCRNVPRPDADRLTRLFSANDPGYGAGRRETRLPDAATYAALSTHEKRLLYNFNDVASAVRRELWERHPFPRTWFGEDVLLARAILEAGFSVVYDDEAQVEHSHDYSEHETRERARIDARFNAEWLDRTCVASSSDARVLTQRMLEGDHTALREAGLSDADYGREIERASRLRSAAFEGLHEGGQTSKRYPRTRMLTRTSLSILYVVHGFPPETWAGTEIYTQNLALEMQRRGHAVTVFTRAPASTAVEAGGPRDFSLHSDEFQGLRVVRMTHRLEHRSLRDTYEDERAEAAFRGVLEDVKPDLVHFQHLIHVSSGLVRVAAELGLPTVLTCHDYWALCARVQMIRPDGVRCEENQGAGCFWCIKDKRLSSIPRLKRLDKAVPGLFDAVASGERSARRARLPAAFQKNWQGFNDMRARETKVARAYASADVRISPSRFLRQKLLDSGTFDPHTFLYSDNGMRVDHVRALTKVRDYTGKVRFGFVGSLVWYKGVAVLLGAMKRLEGERAELHVYGDFKPDADEHHRELARLAGHNVTFHGRFDNARLSEVHAGIDVLLVPSVWFENSPITIHEAWMTHTPVIASDIGGMQEFVRDGVDGLTFKTGDEADLAAKMKRFVDEPDLLERLSRDFPRVKTIAEDAAVTEFRYRALCCVERRPDTSVDRVLGVRAGIETVARAGGAEQQGADMLLLRSGSAARAEYDIAGLGGGRRRVSLEQFALGAEPDLVLGARVFIDGSAIGDFPAFRPEGKDLVRSHTFELELPRSAARLVVECLPLPGGGASYARIQRILVVVPAQAAVESMVESP